MYEMLGYSDEWTVEPGQTIKFMVSCDGVETYNADIVRIRCGDASAGTPGLKETAVDTNIVGALQGRKQFTEIGSYGLIDSAASLNTESITIILSIMPTLPQKEGKQFIIGRWSESAQKGYGLWLNDEGCLVWQQGDGKGRLESLTLSKPMVSKQWYRIFACFDAQSGLVHLAQQPNSPLHALNSGDEASTLWNGMALSCADELPLSIAAAPTGLDVPRMCKHFNGRIDSPTLLAQAQEIDVLEQLKQEHKDRRYPADVLLDIDFAQGITGDVINDTGPFDLHGKLYNIPVRAVAGALWNRTHHSWKEHPAHFAAVHFHDDSLEDAQWECDFQYTVPSDLKSGIYAARLTSGDAHARIVFFVRPKRGAKRAKIAFLASTATYMAYSNSHYRYDVPELEQKNGTFTVLQPWDIYLNEHRELGLSVYDTHSDGYGCYYSSRRRPLFSATLLTRTWALTADTLYTDWLDEKGFDYDVITDEMLHTEGMSAVEGYNVIVTGAHPEYWSTPMWDTAVSYQAAGGRLMYMGGNGFYWRVAFNEDKPWLMELRRAETGARYYAPPPGDCYHSFTGEYGGLWRHLGEAPQTLVGVGCVAAGFDASSYYRRRPESNDMRAAFMFEGIDDQIIGDFGACGGGAAGDEIDRADFDLGTPPHALIVARSEKHTPFYTIMPEESLFHIPAINGEEAEACYADIVFYECLNGGAVFATGSIAWGGSLSWNGYDNNVSRLTYNVLTRFAKDEPFSMPTQPIKYQG